MTPGMSVMRAHCCSCDWTFDVVVLPMPVTTAAKAAMAAHCPMCGNGKGNTVAPARPLSEVELAHKHGLLSNASHTRTG